MQGLPTSRGDRSVSDPITHRLKAYEKKMDSFEVNEKLLKGEVQGLQRAMKRMKKEMHGMEKMSKNAVQKAREANERLAESGGGSPRSNFAERHMPPP